MSDLVALVNNRGASEANVDCVSYPADVEGIFRVPVDVAQALLALPAGFAATHDEQPLENTMTRDFLALDPNGNVQPGAQIEVGSGGRYEADFERYHLWRQAEPRRQLNQRGRCAVAAARLGRSSPGYRRITQNGRAARRLRVPRPSLGGVHPCAEIG